MMAGWRQAVELAMTDEELAKLARIACSGPGKEGPTQEAAQTDAKPVLGLPRGRMACFEFTFTPKHGSWLNLIEAFFSKNCPLGPPSHPRRVQARAEGAHHGRYRRRQSPSRIQHLVLQARQGRLM
jgi:hypothetical protein